MRRLATGGMAEIYLARTVDAAGADTQLVVKRMLPDLARDPAFVEMFLAEAEITSRLAHPNIVRVAEIGEDGGNYFYAMEYVRGSDLLELMRVLSKQHKAVPIEVAVAIVIRVCLALEHTHALCDDSGRPLDVVHRDISLGNILVGYDGSVKLADFGVVRHGGRARTEPGILKGKLGYMSPEQCLGERLDGRSDLFSLGVVLYEITTGERVFPPCESDEATVTRIIQCAIKPPTELQFGYPIDLGAIVMTALQRDPSQRYQTARDLRRDLQAFLRVHRLEGARSSIGTLVTRAFPIASPRPRARESVELDSLVGSLPPLMPRTVSDRDLVPVAPLEPPTALLVAPPPARPVLDLGYRKYLPAALAISIVVVGIAISAWAAWSHVHTPAETLIAIESNSPPITISSTRWSEPAPGPTHDRAAATPPRTTAPPPRSKPPRVTTPSAPRAPRASQRVAAPTASAPPVAEPEVARTVAPQEPDHVVVEDEPRPARPAPLAFAAPKPAQPETGSLDAVPAIATLDVHGPLPTSVVRQGVERTMTSLRTCYRTAAQARGLTLPATLKITFEIDETRVATNVGATGGAGLAGLAACGHQAATQIRTRLAPDVGDAKVVVTIQFRPT